MATFFLKSFMEAVNLAAGKAAQKAQDPQSCKTERKTWPKAAPNALLELTSKEALEEWSNWPGIVVVPQTMQESPEDNENILKISGELTERMELADRTVVWRWAPVEDPEEEMGSFDSNPVLTTIDEMGPETETRDIVQDAKFFQEAATEYQLGLPISWWEIHSSSSP